MKVGMIGLGRMGEGMSRRLIAAGHIVHGYRNNYAKAEEQYEKGYFSGVTTSIENLAYVVKTKELYGEKSGETIQFPQPGVYPWPGVFMMVVPAESVEDTINELLRFCREGDIIIDHGNSNFKDSWERSERLTKLGIAYIDCGTTGGVSGLDHGYGLVVTGGKYAVDTCRTIFDAISPGIKPSGTKNDYVMYPQDYGWIYRNW